MYILLDENAASEVSTGVFSSVVLEIIVKPKYCLLSSVTVALESYQNIHPVIH